MRFPNESTEYRAARERVLQKEIEARRAVEAAARARREMPRGGEVPEDYIFKMYNTSGVIKSIPMSELFGDKNTLAVYSFMYGADAENPCPMCTGMLDGLNGVEDHIRQRLSLAVVAQSSPQKLFTWARKRGWNKLRLLSAAGNSYNTHYHGFNSKGHDDTMLNIFQRQDGKIYHFWGSEIKDAPKDPGQDHRIIDMINPVFNMLDLTPEGRGDFYTKLYYDLSGTEK